MPLLCHFPSPSIRMELNATQKWRAAFMGDHAFARARATGKNTTGAGQARAKAGADIALSPCALTFGAGVRGCWSRGRVGAVAGWAGLLEGGGSSATWAQMSWGCFGGVCTAPSALAPKRTLHWSRYAAREEEVFFLARGGIHESREEIPKTSNFIHYTDPFI